MDITGLDTITTASEMLIWLADNCITPINPAMSGSDFGAIMQKIVEVTSGAADISLYLKSLQGYVGDGTQMLCDDLKWHPAIPLPILDAPRLNMGTVTNSSIALNWNLPANASLFTLQRALDSYFTTDVTMIYNGSNTAFVDTALAPATNYWYRIKCSGNGFADSPYSTIVEGTTIGAVSFLLTGQKFPLVVDANNVAKVNFGFNAPTVVTVNWGDGTVTNFNTVLSGGYYWLQFYDAGANVSYTPPSYGFAAYNYADGSSTIQRNVTFSFNQNALVQLSLQLIKLDTQSFSFEFSKYPALTSFNVSQIGAAQNGAFTDFNLSNIPSTSVLSVFGINNAFVSGSAAYTTIPMGIFSLPIQFLIIGSGGLTVSSFSSCNLDKIGAYLASTLTTLQIQGTPLTDTNNGQGALPSNFNLLTKLQSITLATTHHTTTPSVLNSVTSLTSLTLSYSGYFTSYGDFSALTNLTSINFAANSNFTTTTLPTYFSNLTKLKSINYQNFSGVLDNLITSWYNLVVANAAMTGASTLAFRGISFNVSRLTLSDNTQIPGGTYQQPSGYVQGSANGSPASSLERIWVLVHQYAHVWSYRTS